MEKVLVSACLVGCRCRYDGEHAHAQLPQNVELVPVCPEVAGGLPIPRDPAEIIGGTGNDVLAGRARVCTRAGRDVTAQFKRGAEHALRICREEGIIRAILKRRSPSCGATQVYDGTFSGRLIAGAGVTAALLLQHGIPIEER
ncbi:MAG TPA: DUF523 domain-containing protein [Firmicutes bacterium]|jgi:uncharacterized protein YbbK (DUF523 family)|nr:DUF523 domain-containing protein [Bacillota bacterium]